MVQPVFNFNQSINYYFWVDVFMKLLNETLFWLHLAFIPLAISTGGLFPLRVVLILVLLHRAHTLIFKGCAFSKIERVTGGLPKDSDFLQYSTKRLIGKDISRKQSKMLDYSFVSITLLMATIRFFL